MYKLELWYVFPRVSDVHYTLAQTGSLCKTLASQRLFLSIPCIMDFIVIIKEAHVQGTGSGDTKQKWSSCPQIELKIAGLPGHHTGFVCGFLLRRCLVWRNTPEIENCSFNFVPTVETKLCWLHSCAWPPPASSFLFSCCHMTNRMLKFISRQERKERKVRNKFANNKVQIGLI